MEAQEVGKRISLRDNENVHLLPKYVIFQSNINNLYLHSDAKNPDVPNALRFAGDYSFGLETRYEVVPDSKETGLIHILSLRNNMYWEISEAHDKKWITATAKTPEEKQCTLFEPVFVGFNNKHAVKLRHVNTGLYVRMFNGSDHYDGCLYLDPVLQDSEAWTFINWKTVVVLPDLVRIKGDNGNHLKAFGGDGYMDYNNKPDNTSLFDFQVHPSRDGGVRLRSTYYDKYWTDMDDSYWVLLKEASTTVHETNTVFLPTIVSGNHIVMRCLRNGYFCKRLSDKHKTSCVATVHSYPDEWSIMEIEEPLISREIYNIRYHYTDARRYDEKTVALIDDDSSNDSKATELKTELNLKTKVTNTATWTNNVGFKVGVEIKFEAGLPVVGKSEIGVSTEFTASRTWGVTEEKEVEVGKVVSVTVPPKTRLKGSLMATRCSFDIPFSYTQHDVLKDGTPRVTEKDDGVLTGHNGYGYKHKLVELPLGE
ncbi:hypothetical protein MKW98_020752 [Papaver atlanticum]|uniref:Agglutinin domain-containing protein n=1 Tax=Papaver atlanticum TaxID=357466 RepID=A0AAD4TIK6_9MAGN|nr:hypothetical protein MKW98_020752 [Papaver atlanticum]